MEPGDIAFKSNFSTMEGEIVTYRRCDRHFEHEGPILCQALDGIKIPEFPEVGVSVVYATEHRCAVRIRAKGMSDRITGTDPIHDNKPLEKSAPAEQYGRPTTEQVYTAAIVNALSDTFRRALPEHQINKDRVAQGKQPANVILLRGPGMRLNVKTFDQVHNIKAFMIAPTAIIAGLGISIGLPIIKVEGATGDMDSNFDAKAHKAAELLEGSEYDMGIIHMKGIDDASHDGKPGVKMALIERADRAIRILIEKLSAYEVRSGEHFIIGVVADHSTSSSWLDHTFEPVPVCFSEVCSIAKELGIPHKQFDARYIESDNIERYTEVDACRGSLGRFCGAKLLELMFHYAGRDGISH
jgi:2,3-diphosphopglycerate-independent phosphoglycerate mutase